MFLTITCALAAIAAAQADPNIDNHQPPTPSSTKARFAPSFSGGQPGDLLSHKEIGTDINGARAWKVRHVSKDVNGVVTDDTGVVIAPKEKGENRKVMTWCHGTTGLGDAACPSAQPSPARELIAYYDAASTQQIDYGVPGLQGFIDDGYVVCATDYGDLKLIGTVPMSPVTTAVIFGFPTGPTALSVNPAKAPEVHVTMMLAGLQAANPDKLKLSDFFTPLGVKIIETSWNIQSVHHLGDTIDRLCLLKGPVVQAKPANLDKWKEAVAAASAATRKPCARLLICMDNGTYNPLPWQQALADEVKKLGGNVETKKYSNDDHFSLPSSCAPDAREWLNGLF